MAVIQPFFKNMEVSTGKNPRLRGAGGCHACGLYAHCKTSKMEATGEGQKGILVLAEAPGAQEDEEGIQLVGKSGMRLRRELAKLGIDLDKDCRKLNAVNCRPPKNRTPTDIEVACCRHRVMREIREFKPKVILALGGAAMKSLCQHRSLWDSGFPTITSWQGEVIPDQELGCYIIPTWHPAFLLRLNGDPVYERKWRQDLKNVRRMLNAPRPEKEDYASLVECIADPVLASRRLEHIYQELRELPPDGFVAFDYETTGLKPYTQGHKIVCCSLAWGEDKCICFPTTPETWPWLYRILRSPDIPKAAHNIKFEHLWTKARGYPDKGGFDVRNWHWDSMLASHILDNRKGKSGLKLQSYLKFGMLGYDDDIGPYIRNKDKDSSNKINNIANAPMQKLLLYCALDSLLEYRLAKMQMKQVEKEGLQDACRFFFDGAIALTEAEFNGIEVDLDRCRKQQAELEAKIKEIKLRMEDYEEVKLWRKMAGANFNLASAQQLSALLYDKLEIECPKQTTSGGNSVDKSVLEDIDRPFIQDLLYIRKLEKIKTTYLKAYETEAPDGHLHCFYHLNKVVSFRGSCSNPNFQNVPKRDKEAQKIVRTCLYPKKGYCWFEADFSGVEVRVSASYHKDPKMIAYLHDPHSDMHRDTAMDVCKLGEEQVSKYLRQAAKNGFVFPQFYGDWYVGCANNMWHKWFSSPDAKLADGKTHIKTWLAKHKIKSYEQFEAHMRKVEKQFWGERFKIYDQWREQHWAEYQEKGYMWGLTGFKYTAIMDKKQCNNFCVQGSAFHCMLWSFIQLTNKIRRERLKSYLLGQIHDSINGGLHPQEMNYMIPAIREIMVDKLTKHYSWINVPIDVDIEVAPLNASWRDVRPISKRPEPCDCGLEWGYANKMDNGVIWWTCPVCDAA